MTKSVLYHLQDLTINSNTSVKGWITSVRKSKNCIFISINDGSCLRSLQCVLNNNDQKNVQNYKNILNKITLGCSIKLTGQLIKSPSKQQPVELQITNLEILAYSDPDYPLQKKAHTLEYLRKIAHLRPRTRTISAVLRIRHALSIATHKFFDDQKFFWAHTPILSSSDCEGAGQAFQVTNLDLSKYTGKTIDYGDDFFHKKTYLTVSGQLQAEYLAMGLSKVYTFGPTFRAENSQGRRHLAEFWMIEPEMLFFDLNQSIQLAEAHFKYMIKYCLDNCLEDLEFFHKFYRSNSPQDLKHIANSSSTKIDYSQAVEIINSNQNKTFESKILGGDPISLSPIKWGDDLNCDHERFLTEVHFLSTVFISNYPKDCKAFYMRLNDDNKTVSCMDYLVPKVGELIGGSQREERYQILKNRMDQLSIQGLGWYLDLRKYGCPIHSGYGLGLERMILFLTNVGNIRDTIPSPRTPGNIKF